MLLKYKYRRISYKILFASQLFVFIIHVISKTRSMKGVIKEDIEEGIEKDMEQNLSTKHNVDISSEAEADQV